MALVNVKNWSTVSPSNVMSNGRRPRPKSVAVRRSAARTGSVGREHHPVVDWGRQGDILEVLFYLTAVASVLVGGLSSITVLDRGYESHESSPLVLFSVQSGRNKRP
jgi:hypothetical protein